MEGAHFGVNGRYKAAALTLVVNARFGAGILEMAAPNRALNAMKHPMYARNQVFRLNP